LETALNVLKSPMVEKGLLKKAKEILTKGAESTAEKGVQQGLGKLMEAAGHRIAELIGLLFYVVLRQQGVFRLVMLATQSPPARCTKARRSLRWRT
jgi:hypothetical protein